MNSDNQQKKLPKARFWDFISIRVYRLPSEKWLDFFFGFFILPFTFGILFGSILSRIISSQVTNIMIYLVHFISIFYFYRKRKYIAFGLISILVLGVVFSFLLTGKALIILEPKFLNNF